jgi:LmbE family N-acetylglucosaminyl deacetylase
MPRKYLKDRKFEKTATRGILPLMLSLHCIFRQLSILILVSVWVGCARTHLDLEVPPDPTWQEVTLEATDRILILAPHPDDEILATAGVIHEAIKLGLPIQVVFYTYGDNNVWSFTLYKKRPVLSVEEVRKMGEHRFEEANAAAKEMGLSPDQLIFLGYPDFGTQHIWREHWKDEPPFRSMFTKATNVPYSTALNPGAPYKGESILQDLKTVIRDFHPTKVFVSHPADYNPDHRTLYVFTRVALWDLAKDIQTELYPALTHYKVWPSEKPVKQGQPLGPPSPLFEANQWQVFFVSAEARKAKQSAIEKHATQYGYSPKYLNSFVRENELFGDFPDIVLIENTLHPTSLGKDDDPIHLEEELTPEELAADANLDEVSVQYEDDSLIMNIQHSKNLSPGARIGVGTFGYRPDVPFPDMPKLSVWIGPSDYSVEDQDTVLPKNSIQITRSKRNLTIRIPLSLLGNPDRILAGARATFGETEVDWAAWRIIWLGKM